MENGQVKHRMKMIEQFRYDGEDFKSVFSYESWKIGILRKSERFSVSGIWERHNKTAEVFVLLSGAAVLYAMGDDGETEKVEMKIGTVYNIPTNVWHHIVAADEDTTVLVVENASTSKENTEKLWDT